jgi:hypothetical protein
MRPITNGQSGLDVLDVVLVRVPADVHRVVEEEVEVDPAHLLEVDHRVSAQGDVRGIRSRPRLVDPLEDPSHAEIDDGLLRFLLEGEGHGEVDVLARPSERPLLEERLVRREPEDGRRVGGQALDGHLRVGAGPDDPVFGGEVRVPAALGGGRAAGDVGAGLDRTVRRYDHQRGR